MSKKDFNALAAALLHIADREVRAVVAGEVATWCKCRNPAFDRQRFYAACGL